MSVAIPHNHTQIMIEDQSDECLPRDEGINSASNLEDAIVNRRSSLTIAEIAFLQDLSKIADTEKIALVNESLSNSNLFFDSFGHGSIDSLSCNNMSSSSISLIGKANEES